MRRLLPRESDILPTGFTSAPCDRAAFPITTHLVTAVAPSQRQPLRLLSRYERSPPPTSVYSRDCRPSDTQLYASQFRAANRADD